MRQNCCGKPLDYDKEKDSYSCANCGGHIGGPAARASEDPLTPAPEVLDNIASMTDDPLTNTVLKQMVLDRDVVLERKDEEIKALKAENSSLLRRCNSLTDSLGGIPD